MGNEKRPLTYDDFWDLNILGDVQISPDGTRAAYVVNRLDRETDEPRAAVWVMNLQTLDSRRFTTGAKRDTSPRWSPDGTALAFASTREADTSQIYVMPASGGEARRVTNEEDGARSPAWSPDGTRLAYLVDQRSTEWDVPAESAWAAEKPERRRDNPRLRRITVVKYRSDGRGYLDRRSHISVVDLAGGAPRRLTMGDWDDADPAWSPDGSRLAFISNRTEERARNFAGDIWTVEVESGALRCLTAGTLTAALPSWSPDGAAIAFYGQPEWIANGTCNSHVWTVPDGGGEARDLMPGFDFSHGAFTGDYGPTSSCPPAWSPDGTAVYCTMSVRGGEVLCRVVAAGGTVEVVSPAQVHVSGHSACVDGAILYLADTPSRPYELFRLQEGQAPEQISHANAGLVDSVRIFAAEGFTFASFDGLEIDGWVIRPEVEPEPAPLILLIHGGPHSMFGWGFFYNMQVLAGAGMGCVYFNPRGSGGYGLDFMRKVVADWGGDDYRDLMAGLDHVLALGGFDPTRLGVTGVSYGGYMTNWIVGHSNRFAAAVSVNGISNLISFWGTSDIGALWYERQMGGSFWEHPERYRERSPLTHVQQIRTPLLLLHAENDYRCPIEQSEQFFAALAVLGRSAEFIRIPNASHSLANTPAPHHRIERWRLGKEWFETNLTRNETR